MIRGRRGGVVLVVTAALVSACGMKGDPLPPLRRFPARVADLAVRRTSDQIEVTFTVPAANMDGSTPVALDRVEVYAATAPAADPPLTPAQLFGDARNVIGRIVVRPTDSAASGPDDHRLRPGERASFIDRIDPSTGGNVTRYVGAVAMSGSYCTFRRWSAFPLA